MNIGEPVRTVELPDEEPLQWPQPYPEQEPEPERVPEKEREPVPAR